MDPSVPLSAAAAGTAVAGTAAAASDPSAPIGAHATVCSDLDVRGDGRPASVFLVRDGDPVGRAYGAAVVQESVIERPAAEDPAAPEDHGNEGLVDPVDPFEDADALEELGDEIATLAAHIHAATARFLELVADFDRRRGWELGGHRSCAHWLHARTGLALGAAREKVRTARALVELPRVRASMGRGELSFSAVRALSRIATPETEGEMLELARGATTAQIERMVRGFRLGGRADEATLERERFRSRRLSVRPGLDGMYVVRGRLPAETGALLMRALEAAGDALYKEEWEAAGAAGDVRAPASPSDGLETHRAATRRRADALGLLAERALGAGFGTPDATPDATPEDPDVPGVPISGTRAERYQVVLHVSAETLETDGELGSDSRSHLDDGTRVSAETSRRLACDSALVRMTHGAAAEGQSILGVGRRTRSIPPALRRALDARDQGCRFPRCGLRFTDAHHVTHWADGGTTSLANCLLLCRHHHRLVHEGGWRIVWWGEGRPLFIDPRGHEHFDGRWQPGPLPPRPGDGPPTGDRPPRRSLVRPPPRPGDPQPLRSSNGQPPGDEQPTRSAVDDGPHAPNAAGREDSTRTRSAGPVDASTSGSLSTLLDAHRAHGIAPDGWTAGARWLRETDLPHDLYFQTLDAMDRAAQQREERERGSWPADVATDGGNGTSRT